MRAPHPDPGKVRLTEVRTGDLYQVAVEGGVIRRRAKVDGVQIEVGTEAVGFVSLDDIRAIARRKRGRR